MSTLMSDATLPVLYPRKVLKIGPKPDQRQHCVGPMGSETALTPVAEKERRRESTPWVHRHGNVEPRAVCVRRERRRARQDRSPTPAPVPPAIECHAASFAAYGSHQGNDRLVVWQVPSTICGPVPADCISHTATPRQTSSTRVPAGKVLP